jgi:hypothetical protein
LSKNKIRLSRADVAKSKALGSPRLSGKLDSPDTQKTLLFKL